jgi:NADPH:quinone reductase-like Zn-dependent oxidoreductase
VTHSRVGCRGSEVAVEQVRRPPQLTEITSLIDRGVIRPVVDKVYLFESTKDALDCVESGQAKGKVVVTVK